MRHQKVGRKLGRSAEHRRALIRNLMIELIDHRKIQTTMAKAKTVQPAIENLLALAREDTPQSRKVALSRLSSKEAMRALFAFAPQEYSGRNGGFTRITKLGPRLGDGAEMVVIELL